MKNQYFGDVNDYRKYGLLRLLTGRGSISAAICWMLTQDDTRRDGGRISYLHQPEQWSRFDRHLYDLLHDCVVRRNLRSVRELEAPHLLSNCRFFIENLADNGSLRREYFCRFLEFARGADLLFFDPDNGMEVATTPRGRTGSSKYLYWDEATQFFGARHSLLLYQHFPHENHDRFTRRMAESFCRRMGVGKVYSYTTENVVFFLLPQREHEDHFIKVNALVDENWRGQIILQPHTAPVGGRAP
jgi:hypothetical protein